MIVFLSLKGKEKEGERRSTKNVSRAVGARRGTKSRKNGGGVLDETMLRSLVVIVSAAPPADLGMPILCAEEAMLCAAWCRARGMSET